jgi:serine/threonine protein kinase
MIGHGGMSEVQAGHDARLDRPVAIKWLRRDIALQPAVRRRFTSEARLAAKLVHPNVVAVFDSGEDHGRPFLIMERLPGRTLRDVLRAGPLPPEAARQLAVEVLGALQAAHAEGIVHRDVKPGNILVGSGGQWKIGDFGIAKALLAHDPDQTATGVVVGTPAYLAPERFLGAAATVQSDIYALGVVLYEAVAGQRPLRADSPEEWASIARGARPAPLRLVQPEVDESLALAIERALAKDLSQRWQSAAAMTAAIEATQTDANPTVAIVDAAPSEEATQLLAEEDQPRAHRWWWARPRGQGRRRLGVFGLGAAAAAAAIAIIIGTGSTGKSVAPTTTPATSPAPHGTSPAPVVAPVVAPVSTTLTTAAPSPSAPSAKAGAGPDQAPAPPRPHGRPGSGGNGHHGQNGGN